MRAGRSRSTAQGMHVTGYFYSSSITWGSTILTNALSAKADIFVVRINSTGAVAWAKSYGSTDLEESYSIAVDSGSSLYVTGVFASSSLTLGTQILTNTFSTTYDGFLLKLSKPSGAFVAAASVCQGTSSDYAFRVGLDSSGNIFLGGDYGSATVTILTTILTRTGSSDGWVAKLDSSFSLLWARNIQSTSATNTYVETMAVDPSSGAVVFTGVTTATVSTIVSTTAAAVSSGRDLLIGKISSAGSVQWLRRYGQLGSGACYGITVDSVGAIYATGYFDTTGTLTLGSTPLSANSSSGSIFFAKLNSSGSVSVASSYGGKTGAYGDVVALGASGDVYLVGTFSVWIRVASTKLKTAGPTSTATFISRLLVVRPS
jgi:hypothetical protein